MSGAAALGHYVIGEMLSAGTLALQSAVMNLESLSSALRSPGCCFDQARVDVTGGLAASGWGSPACGSEVGGGPRGRASS